jgi:hypothetical protein
MRSSPRLWDASDRPDRDILPRMSFATSIREFIDTLFPHRTVLLLRREIEDNARQSQERESILVAAYNHEIEAAKEAREAASAEIERLFADHAKQIEEVRRERDYFRGRAERLELRLIPVVPEKRERTAGKIEQVLEKPAGTRWQKVQQEHAAKLQREREAEKAKPIDAPRAAPSAADLDAVAQQEDQARTATGGS